MPCFHPIDAWRTKDGTITFKAAYGIGSSLRIACGQCVGCRLERSRQWAVRCHYEAQMHEENSFLTLTYSDENLPAGNTLVKRHFQLFMKNLRKKYCSTCTICRKDKKSCEAIALHEYTPKIIRYFQCGEYGEKNGRAHYHAILFGLDFKDKELCGKNKQGDPIFQSQTLNEIWGLGQCFIGAVTFASSAYVARYIMKKVTGEMAEKHYEYVNPSTGEITSREPEYVNMSRCPGIGRTWYDKYSKDVFPHDSVVIDGKVMQPPKFFLNLKAKEDEKYVEQLKHTRAKKMSKHKDNNTPQRLAVRKKVCVAKTQNLKREI